MSQFAVANILQNAQDGKTMSLVHVGQDHHEIHEGCAYYVEGYASLTDTQQLTVKFTTPVSPTEAHFEWALHSGAQMEVFLYEDAAGGMAGGTTHVPINQNRNSTNASDVVFVSGCTTSTAVGARLHSLLVGTTAPNPNAGASPANVGRGSEMLLKTGSTYLGIIKSNDDDNPITFRAMWYEHTPYTGLKVAD